MTLEPELGVPDPRTKSSILGDKDAVPNCLRLADSRRLADVQERQDQGVTIAQTLTARRNVVSEVRGQEASLLLSAGEESQHEREEQREHQPWRNRRPSEAQMATTLPCVGLKIKFHSRQISLLHASCSNFKNVKYAAKCNYILSTALT